MAGELSAREVMLASTQTPFGAGQVPKVGAFAQSPDAVWIQIAWGRLDF